MGKTKDIVLKAGIELSRIILGIVFIFSGFVKSIDPLGTVYKIEDYFTAFGFSQFHDFAFILSIIQCAGELALGIFCLMGLYRKWTSRFLFLVMLFMTPLTLYLAIANPVKDCGCFGDALIITNWQTFYKNIILLACSILLLIHHQKITNFFTGKFYWLAGLYIIVYSFGLCFYNYYNEPMIDFRPFKIGNNISELMKVSDENAPVYENIMIYEKDGAKKEFTEDNYPWEDSTWRFVDRESRLIKKGEEPVISDFAITHLFFNHDRTEIEGSEDITQELLTDSSYIFLMTAYSLNNMREGNLSKFEDVNNYAKENGYKFYCLTSSPETVILQLEKDNITNFDFCTADERVLKTMVRSNPGLLLLKEGIIINKWSDNDVPDESLLTNSIENLSISKIPDSDQESKKHVIIWGLILFVPLIATKIFDGLLYNIKRHQKSEKEKIQ